jgi:hypothetical protein
MSSCWRLSGDWPLADRIDHLQHVQQNRGIVTTAMAQHIEGGVEQVGEGNRFENQAEFAVSIPEMRGFRILLGEERQALSQVIQAGHGGVIFSSFI